MTASARSPIDRRCFLAGAAAMGVSLPMGGASSPAQTGPKLTRTIPGTNERIPVIGMGSWITFNVGSDPQLRAGRVEVLRTFFEMGGGVVDSSPMYGSSEEVIGHCLQQISDTSRLFSATKVWTRFQRLGVRQMENSRGLWGVRRFDLMQVHNLLDWEAHLETLRAWKDEGRVRKIGITTSHGRRHEEFEKVMTSQPLDFVQFSYNILDREAEKRLLPVAADRGLAVIINRPFRRKELFHLFDRHPLPEWIGEFDCSNWAQFFLKFIVSHPAVTCAIPATTRVDHMRENMGALAGRLPDPEMRSRMIRYVENL